MLQHSPFYTVIGQKHVDCHTGNTTVPLAHSCTHILTDSARKRNRTEVLSIYNKTTINKGHEDDMN